MSPKKRRGLFIVFEGIDGAGTTSQCEILVKMLRGRGEKVHLTREPTTGPIGVQIRHILSGRLVSRPGGNASSAVDPATIALLFAADRIDHLQNEIHPFLEAGHHVICDRYVLSSLAYQSVDVDLKFVRAINAKAATPDITFFLDVSPEVAMQRIQDSRTERDLFETLPFQRKVAQRYKQVVDDYREGPIEIIDGEEALEKVTSKVTRALESML